MYIYLGIFIYIVIREGEGFLIYLKILVIEFRRFLVGCESRLLKRRGG